MFDKYVGLAVHGERPCWQLVRRVLKEQAGLDMPSYEQDDHNGSTIQNHARAFKEVPVSLARALDVAIIMNAQLENGKYVFRPVHVGIFCNTFQILHVNRGQLSCVQPVKEFKIHSILRVTDAPST